MPCCDDGVVEEHVRSLVDADWESRLGVERSLLQEGGVHVVVAELGANDAMSFLFGETCVFVVPEGNVDAARSVLRSLNARAAFTSDALRSLVGSAAQVDGPSWHAYVDDQSFLGTADDAAQLVDRGDASLLKFLEANDLGDWAESGFPRDPSAVDSDTTRFWVLREHGQVVVAGNMTEWRGLPADVGVLTRPDRRRHGLAGRLVGSMVAAALPEVGVARYRALTSNLPSLNVARRLGFEPYGQNFRARRATG